MTGLPIIKVNSLVLLLTIIYDIIHPVLFGLSNCCAFVFIERPSLSLLSHEFEHLFDLIECEFLSKSY